MIRRLFRLPALVFAFLAGSIRRQLVLAFGSVALLLMLGFGAMLLAHQRHFLYAVSLERATSLAHALSASSTPWVLANDVVGLHEVLQGFVGTRDLHRAFVLSLHGEVLASSRQEEVGRFVTDPLSHALLDDPAVDHVMVDEPGLVDVAVPVLAGDRLVGWVRIELTRESANANLRELLLVGMGFALLALLSSALVSLWLAGRLTLSLRHLMEVAGKVEGGRRDMRANTVGASEIAQLGRSFNNMLDALGASEARLERLNQLYDVLRLSNEAIVRQNSVPVLLREICNIVMAHLYDTKCMVGLLDRQSGWVKPVAYAGFHREQMETFHVSMRDDVAEGQGPAGHAMRDRRPVVCNDYLADPSTAPWHQFARDETVAAVAIFPLHSGDTVVGFLGIYATRPQFFDTEIVDLVTELAGDISYALENHDREKMRQQAQDELRKSEARLRQAQAIGRIGYWEMDALTRKMEWSEETFRLLEYEIGSSPPDIEQILEKLPDEDRRKVKALTESIDKISETVAHDFAVKMPSGRVAYFHVAITPVQDEWQHTVRLRGTLQDITERKLAEEKLAQAAKVFESTSEGIMITDADANIISVNWAFEAITGYTEEEVLGRNPSFLASGRHDDDFYRKMWASMKKKGGWQGEIWNRRRNGEIYPEWLNISNVRDANGKLTNYVAIFTDISERKLAEERMRHLAHHDVLTDLPNRMLMLDRLEQALVMAQRRKGSVALLFLDIDHFKTINDTLGHDVGDLLLKEVAHRLQDCVREQDTVARQGGDEFVVILPETDAKGAGLVAQKMLEEISQPMRLQDRELRVTPSIGISLYPEDGMDVDTLIKNADTAMYDAKQSGRGTFKFYIEPATPAKV